MVDLDYIRPQTISEALTFLANHAADTTILAGGTDVMIDLRSGAWAVWLRNATVWSRTWKTSLVGSVGEPLFYFFGLGYGLGTLIPDLGGTPYLHYVAPGLMLSSAMYSTTVEATYSTFTKMEHQRVYASMVLSPLHFSEILMGEVLWAMTKGLLSGGTVLLLSLLVSFLEILLEDHRQGNGRCLCLGFLCRLLVAHPVLAQGSIGQVPPGLLAGRLNIHDRNLCEGDAPRPTAGHPVFRDVRRDAGGLDADAEAGCDGVANEQVLAGGVRLEVTDQVGGDLLVSGGHELALARQPPAECRVDRR